MYFANERNRVLVTYDSSFPCELEAIFKFYLNDGYFWLPIKFVLTVFVLSKQTSININFQNFLISKYLIINFLKNRFEKVYVLHRKYQVIHAII